MGRKQLTPLLIDYDRILISIVVKSLFVSRCHNTFETQMLYNVVVSIERRPRMAGHIIRMPPGRTANHDMSWTLMVVADDEAVQRRRGGPHLRRTWRTEESIGTASGLWLQTGADGELLLPIV